MEMTQHHRGQGLDEDYDDITAYVTTEHAFWAANGVRVAAAEGATDAHAGAALTAVLCTCKKQNF